MEILKEQFDSYKQRLTPKEISSLFGRDSEVSNDVYPFNKYELLFSYLLAVRRISKEEYLKIRNDYFERNKYLHLFEMAPRTFGETWGQKHLKKIVNQFKDPSKILDPTYKGEYDLLLDNIHVEVKASRVVKMQGGGTLVAKALRSEDKDKSKFDMNFQQLKPSCCDVFVWIAVWRDKIDYWVLSSSDVQNNSLFSNQHRASEHSDTGKVVEGQIHINNRNYADFDKYRVLETEICEKVKEKGASVKRPLNLGERTLSL